MLLFVLIISFYLGNLLSYLLPFKGSIIERYFQKLVLGVLITGVLSLTLANLEVYSLLNTFISLLVISILFKVYLELKKIRNRESLSFKLPNLYIIFILIILFLLFYTPVFEWIKGGRDPGVYVSTAAHIANNGKITIDLPYHTNLTKDYIFRNQIFPGFYTSFKGSTPQFLYLFQVWMANFFSDYGLNGALHLNSIFTLLSLLSIYFLLKRVSNYKTGLISLLLLGTSYAQVFYAKYPTSEILTQFFLFAGLYLFSFNGKGYKFFSGFSFAQMLLTRISAFLMIPLLILFFIFEYLFKNYTKNNNFVILGFILLIPLVLYNTFIVSYNYSKSIFNIRMTPLIEIIISPFGIMVCALFIGLTFYFWHKRKQFQKLFKSHLKKILIILSAVMILFLGYNYYLRPEGDIAAEGTTESYNLVKLFWYVGGQFGLFLFALSITFLLFKKKKRVEWFFLLIFITYFIFYVMNAQISLDHPWWVRRFLPIVIPSMYIIISYFLSFLISKKKYYFLGFLILSIFITILVSTTAPIVKIQLDGLEDSLIAINNTIKDNSIVFFHRNGISIIVSTPLNFLLQKSSFLTYQNESFNYSDIVKQSLIWMKENSTHVYFVNPEGSIYNSLFKHNLILNETYNNLVNWVQTGGPRNGLPTIPESKYGKIVIYELLLVNETTEFLIDIGTSLDSIFIKEGFYNSEGDSNNWRWTSSNATITMPNINQSKISLRIGTSRPYEIGPSIGNLSINNRIVKKFNISKDFYETINININEFLTSDFNLTIATNTFVPSEVLNSADNRVLGVKVDWIRLEK